MRCLMNGALRINSPTEETPELEFGDYELLSEMGRGGQGIVYRARQKGLNRLVALKCIPASHFASGERLKRFRLEAEAAARLDHPGIVPIFEIGERHGFCFYSMRLMDGGRLDQALHGEPMNPQAAADTMIAISRTVHYAHQRGILHRDLKPANILLDGNGRPHLSDFGLARLVEQDSTLTHTLAILGTPSYMAPEQAGPTELGGGAREITTAADVYGLGGILYHLLTGGPPFAAGTTFETVRLVLESNPRRPSLQNAAVDRDLETICLKCLEKDPRRRYGSAEALAEELERWRRREPIVARPVSTNERVWRWCRRKPVLAALSALVGFLLLVVGLGAPLAAWRINQERQKAEAEAYAADMHYVQQVWGEGNLRRAQALLQAHVPKKGDPDLRGFEWRYLWNQCQDESEFTFTNFPSGVRALLSPDGGFVAAISGPTLKLLDYTNRREIKALALPIPNQNFTAAQFAPNDTNTLAAIAGRHLLLWNLSQGEVVQSFTLSAAGNALAFSPDGSLVAVAFQGVRGLEVWDLKAKKLLWTQNQGPTDEAGLVAFTPNGRSIFSTGGVYGNPLLWDKGGGAPVALEPSHTTYFGALDLTSDGRNFITGGIDSRIVAWDLESRKGRARMAHPGGAINALRLAPGGEFLATGADDATVRLWNMASGEQIRVYRGHRSAVTGVIFSPDGRLISSSLDGTVKIWPHDPAPANQVLQTNRSWTGAVSFSADGRKLATVDLWAGVLSILDVETGSRITNLTEVAQGPTSGNAKFSPDGRWLVLTERDGRIRWWNAETFEPLGTVTNDFAANSVSISADSTILALSGVNNARVLENSQRLALWDVAAKARLDILKMAAPDAACVAFAQTHPWIAIGSMHGHVSIWNYRTQRLLADFQEQHGRIWNLAFSPDDELLAAGDGDGAVVFYETTRARFFRSAAETSWWVLGLAFSPDGRTLASAESDGAVRLWNVFSHRSALELKGHAGIVSKVAFSPNGNILASCGADGTVRLWRAPSLAEIEGPGRR